MWIKWLIHQHSVSACWALECSSCGGLRQLLLMMCITYPFFLWEEDCSYSLLVMREDKLAVSNVCCIPWCVFCWFVCTFLWVFLEKCWEGASVTLHPSSTTRFCFPLCKSYQFRRLQGGWVILDANLMRYCVQTFDTNVKNWQQASLRMLNTSVMPWAFISRC